MTSRWKFSRPRARKTVYICFTSGSCRSGLLGYVYLDDVACGWLKEIRAFSLWPTYHCNSIKYYLFNVLLMFVKNVQKSLSKRVSPDQTVKSDLCSQYFFKMAVTLLWIPAQVWIIFLIDVFYENTGLWLFSDFFE